jgi:hypothetical protein
LWQAGRHAGSFTTRIDRGDVVAVCVGGAMVAASALGADGVKRMRGDTGGLKS